MDSEEAPKPRIVVQQQAGDHSIQIGQAADVNIITGPITQIGNIGRKYIANAPPPPRFIIGRENDISELKKRLLSEFESIGIGQIISIRGWAGVGKSTLVSALAHNRDVLNRFQDGVLWVSLGQEPNLLAEMATWGRALGSDDLFRTKTVEEASEQLKGILQNKRTLLVLDDVWSAEDALPFMVGGPGCTIVITTRLTEVAQALTPDPNNIYHLSVLTENDSILLLKELAPSVVVDYPTESKELVNELEGLPLALQVAGRLLQTESSIGLNVIQLLKELREGSLILANQAPADIGELVAKTTPTIATLLNKSVERLNDQTKNCFTYLGVFAPKPATFDLEALKFVWQVEDPHPIIRELINRGLLEYVPEMGRYQLHALLIQFAKSLLESEE